MEHVRDDHQRTNDSSPAEAVDAVAAQVPYAPTDVALEVKLRQLFPCGKVGGG